MVEKKIGPDGEVLDVVVHSIKGLQIGAEVKMYFVCLFVVCFSFFFVNNFFLFFFFLFFIFFLSFFPLINHIFFIIIIIIIIFFNY